MVKLKRNLLSVSLVSAMTLSATAAYAQTAEETAAEEAKKEDAVELQTVTVTGIRAGIESAISVKRDSTSIVEAVSAEDIGKLPDVTVADALQRVAGIQIQRSAGEGNTVNIRGLPQVITLLNGEQYLAPGNLGTATPTLNDVPSQLMSSIVVYKSQDVSNALSGISGTIDASTTDRPSTPWTRASGSTTAPAAGSSPMAQVPTGWW